MELVEPPLEVLQVPATEFNKALINHSPYTLITFTFIIGIVAIIAFNKPKTRKAIPLALILFGSLLITPMVPVAHAASFGDPLTTTNIGLFAYYNETTDWTLNDTVTAFYNYTDHTTYYDGYVRVWQDSQSNSSFTGNDVSVDVKLRVRADGWIMAWLDTTIHDAADIPLFGRERSSNGNSAGSPVVNATTCHRAIEHIYYVANKTFPEYHNIDLYDYSQTSATMLAILSMEDLDYYNDNNDYLYFIVPSSTVTTIHKSKIFYGGICGSNALSNNEVNLYFDGTVIFNAVDNDDEIGWSKYNLPTANVTKDAKHTLRCWCKNQAGSSDEFVLGVILWMS